MTILFQIQESRKSNISSNLKGIIILFIISSLNLYADFNYEVEKGDSLYSLSNKYKVPVEDIKDRNSLDSESIRVGQKLVIPTKSIGSQTTSKKKVTDTDLHSSFYYILQDDNTIESVAKKYNLRKEEIIAWNNLKSSKLKSGQKFKVSEPDFLKPYVVGKGDSLLGLAKKFDISSKDIIRFNYLEDENLKIGQKLFLKKSTSNVSFHYVKKGETLGRIAYIYGIRAKDLVTLNGETATNLKAGSLLEVAQVDVAKIDTREEVKRPSSKPDLRSSNFVLHKVEIGETLYSIARKYGVLLEDLKSWNKLAENNIFSNQELKIYSKTPELATSKSKSTLKSISPEKTNTDAENNVKIIANTSGAKSKKSNLDSLGIASKKYDFSNSSLVLLDSKISIFQSNGDFYYWYKPKKVSQPSEVYSENWQSPLNSYKKASNLFFKFKKLVEGRPVKSSALKNKLIVFDPGHGGLDPGAIVKSKDGMGNEIFVVEDEYVYDIALRLYVYLKEHKANVEFTIIAPDHLIRDSVSANNTFVNVKNEVYNDYTLNKNDTVQSWINGTHNGLNKRLVVSKNFVRKYRNIKDDDILFISLHSDNSVGAPKGIGLYYQNDDNKSKSFDAHSKKVAEKMSKNIKKNSYVKGQNLYVLRNNNIKTKLLIELRNLSFQEEAWAIRSSELREQDAKIISGAILKMFQK